MRHVRGLADPPEDLDLDALREAIAVDEVGLAVVFGSYAAGTPGPLSDLDVAVEFRACVPRSRRFECLDELTAAIVDAIGVEAVDLLDLDAVGPRLGYEILAKGRLVYGDESEAVERETNFLLRKLDFKPVKQAWDEALDERIRDGTYGRR